MKEHLLAGRARGPLLINRVLDELRPRRLLSFKGRTPQLGWWLIQFVGFAAFLAVISAEIAIMGAIETVWQSQTLNVDDTLALIILLPSLVPFVWMFTASATRRLHDQGRSGWTQVAFHLPFIGGLLSLILLGCVEGTRGPNRYGPSDKYPSAEPVTEYFA